MVAVVVAALFPDAQPVGPDAGDRKQGRFGQGQLVRLSAGHIEIEGQSIPIHRCYHLRAFADFGLVYIIVR